MVMVIEKTKMIFANLNKLRVLIFHPALAPSRVDIFNTLASRCNLKVMFLRDNLLTQKFDQVQLTERLKIDYGYLKKGFTIRTRSIRFGIGKEIQSFVPDVVVTHEFSPVTMSVLLHRTLLRQRYQHVVWSADNPMLVNSDGYVRKMLRRTLLPGINGLILYTEEITDIYRTRMNYVGPIGVVPNISSEREFRGRLAANEGKSINTILMYGLSGKRVLLYVGRLSYQKRIDRLLRALSVVVTRIDDVVLVLVGDGKERLPLEQLSRELKIENHVIFAGHQEGDSLAAWYRVGLVFALTSEFEPFGAVVNEALLAGMPVVCSDKAGARVLIREGKNGTVIDPEDGAALQAALLYWLCQITPVSTEKIFELRLSLMPVRFQDAVEAYVNLLITVAKNEPKASLA